jgi:D-alanyl-lipoteichoic acid acyltransferase DltB (MBOAT superfamily)
VTLFLFFVIGKINHRLAVILLIFASLFFYSWWKLEYLLIIILSILFNYCWGKILGGDVSRIEKQIYLIIGIAINLGLLGYFKYSNFFLESVNHWFNLSFPLQNLALPLAISFFTFQQVAYLIDIYSGETKDSSFLNYTLFICFFPQLIAGPIVHYRDIIPQLQKKEIYSFDLDDLAIGLSIFAFGLFKKVVIADSLSVNVEILFGNAEAGINLTLFEAWGAALAYTFQLYFDFSGYSDMAIGLARMFRIKLPVNFNSPYQAFCIIDFWRRWHITLSNFLRDYLYIPLGGNQQGKIRRDLNLLITMLLGGLWHGAGWTFVLWGGLHGLYLIINHWWHTFLQHLGYNPNSPNRFGKVMGVAITFTLIVASWVIFRANSVQVALSIWKGMVGLNGIMIPDKIAERLGFFQYLLTALGANFPHCSEQYNYSFITTFFLNILLMLVVWFLPNTQRWMVNFQPFFKSESNPIKLESASLIGQVTQRLAWQLNIGYGIVIGLIFFVIFKVSFAVPMTNFLYFNF